MPLYDITKINRILRERKRRPNFVQRKQILLRWGIKSNWKISKPLPLSFISPLFLQNHDIINVRAIRCYVCDRYAYMKVVCRIACRSLLFMARSRDARASRSPVPGSAAPSYRGMRLDRSRTSTCLYRWTRYRFSSSIRETSSFSLSISQLN